MPDKDFAPLIAGFRARPATAADGIGLRAVELRAIRLQAGAFYAPEITRSWTAGLTPEAYGRLLDLGKRIECAVDATGRVVAFVVTEEDRIDGLFVEPEQMERGLGSVLLARAERRLQDDGFPVARLEAPLGAVPFFVHRGYRAQGTRERASRGGFLMLVYEMTKRFYG